MTVWSAVLTDVVGIVKSAEEIRMLTTKQGKELKKRDIILVDESQVQIRMTLWANDVRDLISASLLSSLLFQFYANSTALVLFFLFILCWLLPDFIYI